jgi:hypothetical protein
MSPHETVGFLYKIRVERFVIDCCTSTGKKALGKEIHRPVYVSPFL